MNGAIHNVSHLARSLHCSPHSVFGPYQGGTWLFARAYGSSSSSKKWAQRQTSDPQRRDAKLLSLKSRAAFKLIEINENYKLMKPGNTVVDLGYAPGSWTQVAVQSTKPGGRVLGVDVIPAAPPKGASSIQGDFLSPSVQAMVRRFLSHPDRGRPTDRGPELGRVDDANWINHDKTTVPIDPPGYIDQERHETEEDAMDGGRKAHQAQAQAVAVKDDKNAVRHSEMNTVDVVLSDMMMNVSGIKSRDHIYSMGLCYAALKFCLDVLKPGGHFVCKFYQGNEDKQLEDRLKKIFRTVHRVKPDASRPESSEAYFVALRKKHEVPTEIAQAVESMVN